MRQLLRYLHVLVENLLACGIFDLPQGDMAFVVCYRGGVAIRAAPSVDAPCVGEVVEWDEVWETLIEEIILLRIECLTTCALTVVYHTSHQLYYARKAWKCGFVGYASIGETCAISCKLLMRIMRTLIFESLMKKDLT